MNDTTPPSGNEQRAGFLYLLLAVCVVLALSTVLLGVKAQGLNATLASTEQQLIGAKAETGLVQADLAKAKEACAAVQAQANAARASCADLQAELDKAHEQKAVADAWLAKAKAEHARVETDLKVQIDRSQVQVSELQGRLERANQDCMAAGRDLEATRNRCLELNTKLEKAQAELARVQPLLAKARQMPVATALARASFPGGSMHEFSLKVSSLQAGTIKLEVTIEGVDGTRTLSNTLEGNTTMKIEKLAMKDRVTLSAEGYDPVVVVVE